MPARAYPALARALTAALLIAVAVAAPQLHWSPCPTNARRRLRAGPSTPVRSRGQGPRAPGLEGLADDAHPAWLSDLGGGPLQCATVTVPLDHSSPNGLQINLAVAMRPASGPKASRIGSYFYNPGGPGGSGYDYIVGGGWSELPQEMLDRFDIVSFDPRGVGRSTPVKCFETIEDYLRYFWQLFPEWNHGNVTTLQGLEALQWIQGGAFPMTEADVTNYWKLNKGIYSACKKMHGPLLQFISTADVARDMDILRGLVGDEKINFYGASYGTLLGAVYANLFPGNVRALVIDGNINPLAWFGPGSDLVLAYRLNSDVGAYDTFMQLLWLCGSAKRGACAFSAGSFAQTRSKWELLWQVLVQQPLYLDDRASNAALGGPGMLTASMLATYLINSLGGYQRFPRIANVLEAVWNGMLNATNLNTDQPWIPIPNIDIEDVWGGIVYNAITCPESPSPAGGHKDLSYYKQAVSETARGELFSLVWMWASGYGTAACSQWPAVGKGAYHGPFNKNTSAPILVIGNRFDPQCPFEDSRRVADDVLANARMLTIHGMGHCLLGNPSACAWSHVVPYFVNGTLPDYDTICEQDSVPFGSRIFA